MKTFTNSEIRTWNPCYDPDKYLKDESENHNVITILDNKLTPFQDRLWVICRDSLVSDKLMRLFAIWCYRQTLAFVKNPDPRSIAAADTAEAYANGLATKEELSASWFAARSAAWPVYRFVVWSASEFDARSAAYSAQEAKLREMLIAGIETGDVK